ncbi:MAG TPA: zinc ribbon domain-containing protein [Blastocatellia bacterium]|jgi:hypothetical protein|nr:zinc ribbon domain-containing protein [Blastocatellia bacterium]
MQQPCKTCGYESPETDKFCRQCGGQLTTETEFTSAATLNHGKVESNSQAPSVGTGRLSPNIADVISADTERYYTPPHYAPAHAPAPAPTPIPIPTPVPVQVAYERIPTYALPNLNPEPHSRFKSFSSFMKGMFAFLLFVALLVTTALTVHFAKEADYARRGNSERENGRGRRVGGNNANNRAQDAWSQMEEALELARDAAEKASAAGATLTTGADKAVDLSKYAFTDAQVEAKIDTLGNETLSLLTRKDFKEVQKFYERMLGNPVLQVATNQRGNQTTKLLFQSLTLPSILVKIEEVDIPGTDRLQVKITVLHSFLRFPKFNEAQAQNLR